jgi:L-ribulokinase
VVGVDYGTLSGRAVVVRVADGAELASAAHEYPHAVMDRTLASSGAPLPPDWALQDPPGLRRRLADRGPGGFGAGRGGPSEVIGIATDFTACTMLPVTSDGTPLCQLDQFVERPHAYVKLWKHHAAQPQAERINAVAEERGEFWLPRYGGKISSEWEFAKGLQLLEEDPEIYATMDHWVEAADWIVWQLCGTYVRNACTAGYKAIRQDEGYPGQDYLEALNPDFGDFVTTRSTPIGQLGDRAGG